MAESLAMMVWTSNLHQCPLLLLRCDTHILTPHVLAEGAHVYYCERIELHWGHLAPRILTQNLELEVNYYSDSDQQRGQQSKWFLFTLGRCEPNFFGIGFM